MEMTLDQLRAEWAARDRQLQDSMRLHGLLLRESFLDRHRSEIERLSLRGNFEFVFAIPFLAFFGWFIAHHFTQPEFLLPALALQAWTLMFAVLGVHQRQALQNLNYGQPVIELQRSIERLKITRLTTFKWAFLTGQLLWWVPFVLVLFKGLFGVNLYTVSAFMPRFIACNILFGVAIIPCAIWVSRRIGGRFGGSERFRKFTDGLAGRDIAVAREFLDRLARFEREAGN